MQTAKRLILKQSHKANQTEGQRQKKTFTRFRRERNVRLMRSIDGRHAIKPNSYNSDQLIYLRIRLSSFLLYNQKTNVEKYIYWFHLPSFRTYSELIFLSGHSPSFFCAFTAFSFSLSLSLAQWTEPGSWLYILGSFCGLSSAPLYWSTCFTNRGKTGTRWRKITTEI